MVLTAAHCVLPGADTKLAEFDAARQPVLKDIATVARHPGFDADAALRQRVTADVALLKLAEPLAARFVPAPLAAPRRPVAVGDRLLVAGYGLAAPGDGRSGGTLRAARACGHRPARNAADPAWSIPPPKAIGRGSAPAPGDSGAPVFEDAGGQLGVLGVVSWTTGPALTERLRRPHRRHAARALPRVDRRDGGQARPSGLTSAAVRRNRPIMLRRAATALACMLVVGAPAAALVGGAIPADHSIARHVVLVLGPRGNGRMACTGTAIARDLVLTAAHCLAGANATVVERDDGRRPRLIRVAVGERHPSFDLDTAVARGETADLALLKLAEPLSSQRLPAVLGERTIVLIGERFTVAGYGVTIDGGDSRLGPLRTATLMAVRAPSQRHFQLADPVTRGETAGLGACSGDSGGPVFEDAGGRLIIMGVVSWATSARGGGGCGGLTGATPLAPFREWIIETARKMGSKL